MTCMRAPSSSKYVIRPPDLAALERLKNSHRLIIGKCGVAAFFPLFLIGSYSYVQVTTDPIHTCSDIHESLDEFEQLPDLTTDHRVSCPLGSENVCYDFF